MLSLFWQSDHWSLRSATETIPLPEPKPRAVREHFVVPSIRSHEVPRARRSNVRHHEDALKALDFGYNLLGVHSVPISNMGVAIVKRSGICMSCLPPRQRSLLGNAPARDEINRKAAQPVTAFIMLPSHCRQPRILVFFGGRHDHRQALVAFGQTRSDTL